MSILDFLGTKDSVAIWAVAIAWGLARFTNVFEWKKKQANRVGQVIVYLRLLRSDLIMAVSILVDSEDCTSYEIGRLGIFRRSFITNRNVDKDIQNYSSVLCYVSPAVAESFAVVIRNVWGVLDSRVMEMQKVNSDIASNYNFMRTLFLNAMVNKVDNLILRISWNCGVGEFFRALYTIGFVNSIKILMGKEKDESKEMLKNMLNNSGFREQLKDVVEMMDKIIREKEEVSSPPTP